MESIKKYGTMGLVKRFSFLAKPYKHFILIFSLASILNTLVNLSEGYLVKDVINSTIARNKERIIELSVYMVGIMIAGAMLNYLMKYIYGLFSANSMRDFRTLLYKHLQKLPLEFFHNKHSGDILSRFSNDSTSMQNFVGFELLNLVLDVLMILAAGAYMTIISWKLFLFSIMLSPIAIFIINRMSNYTKKYSKTSRDYVGKANCVVQDMIGGIFMIKSFNLEKAFLDSYKKETDTALGYSLKETFINACMSPLHVTLRMIPTVMCVSFGAYLSIRKEITPGDLMAFLFLLGYVSWPLAFLTERINNLKSAAGAVERVAELLDGRLERQTGEEIGENSDMEAISLEDLSFGYNPDLKVIDKLNVKIEKGKKVAIVGPSGCGKSTLVKLISGLYEDYGGKIFVLGQDLKNVRLDQIRRHISLVTQDTYLFPETIRENIIYGRIDATEEEIVEAAKIANAFDFITDLPEGFDTLVGERGAKLSGGQKQRIALARAVLKNASIILLDEPTSALDTESELLVQEAMDRVIRDKTAVIVAHRYSTIKNADEILVMDKGTLAEQGTHEELIAGEGIYRQLYEKQLMKMDGETDAEG
jgi:ABC-type multidrug transport system fused ATPase/permease subunit